MKPSRYAATTLAIAAIAATTTGARDARAQNAQFQNFFSNVCGSAEGALRGLCGETPGGGGALSSDSQSSLNPSQGLSGNDRLVGRTQEKARQVQNKMEQLRDDEAAGSGAAIGTYNLFINGRATSFDRDRNDTDQERGFDGDTYTLELGVDRRISPKTVVGGVLAFDKTDSDFDADQPGVNFAPPGNDGSSDADGVSLTVFGIFNMTDQLYLEGSAGYGTTDYTLRRNAVFQETTRTVPQTNLRARGDTDGNDWTVSAGIGADLPHGALNLGVYGRLNYVRSEIDGYTEKDPNGTGLAMRFGDVTSKSFTSVLGVRASYAISQSWGVLIPQGRVEWEHEFEDGRQDLEAWFVQDAAGNMLRLTGDKPDTNYFNLGAGLVFVLPNGWMPFVDTQALVGYDNLSRYQVTVGVRVEL